MWFIVVLPTIRGTSPCLLNNAVEFVYEWRCLIADQKQSSAEVKNVLFYVRKVKAVKRNWRDYWHIVVLWLLLPTSCVAAVIWPMYAQLNIYAIYIVMSAPISGLSRVVGHCRDIWQSGHDRPKQMCYFWFIMSYERLKDHSRADIRRQPIGHNRRTWEFDRKFHRCFGTHFWCRRNYGATALYGRCAGGSHASASPL